MSVVDAKRDHILEEYSSIGLVESNISFLKEDFGYGLSLGCFD